MEVMAPDTAASGPAQSQAGDYEVTLTIPDFDAADGPEDAVRMFIASVQENPDMWCYQVTDDKTGRKWLVDRQGSTREIRARTAIDADVPCHLPRWFNTAGICEHTDHDT